MNTRQWDQFKLYETGDKWLSIVERIVRKIINTRQRAFCQQLSLKTIRENKAPVDDRVVVSLTTFPARIDYVDMAIKSLLNQTIKPRKILLWLARSQFREDMIPDKLKCLCELGLEICYCDEDILAHKKYYYAMLKYPDKIIVTYDDDLIYPEDSLEKLLRMHEKYPDAIICNRGKEIKISGNVVAPYAHWDVCGSIPAGTPSYRIMASTGAGTLYSPHCMPEETFDLTKIRSLALTADDLWMKVMSVKGQIPVVKAQTRCKGLCLSKSKQNFTLAHRNVDQNLNDHVMTSLLQQYPEVMKVLIEEA